MQQREIIGLSKSGQHTFLLRIWYDGDQACWLFLLREPADNRRWIFASQAELTAFLSDRLPNTAR